MGRLAWSANRVVQAGMVRSRWAEDDPLVSYVGVNVRDAEYDGEMGRDRQCQDAIHQGQGLRRQCYQESGRV